MLINRTKMVLSALCLLLFVSCASKEKKIKSEQAALYFGAGTQHMMAQDYTSALTALLKANELEAENSDILNNLGMAYYFKGEQDLAVKSLKSALEVKPGNSDAKINLASIYYRQGNINLSEKLYKEVLRDLTYDKQARTYYNLAVLEIEQRKNPQAAEKYLHQALKEDSNYCPAGLKLGMLQYSSRKFNAALKSFKEASMGICYDLPEPLFYQAMVLTELKKYTEARLKYEELNSRFRASVYGVKARAKLLELADLENSFTSLKAQAPGKVLESPGF